MELSTKRKGLTMGWDGIPWKEGTKVEDFLKERFTWDSQYSNNKVVFYSRKGSRFAFVGAEKTYKDTGKKELYLFVVKIEFSTYHGKREIYIKTIEEVEGPSEEANKKTLDWLEKNIPTPPNEYAKKWRERSKNSLQGIS